MVKVTNNSLITALHVGTSADPHIGSCFTRSPHYRDIAKIARFTEPRLNRENNAVTIPHVCSRSRGTGTVRQRPDRTETSATSCLRGRSSPIHSGWDTPAGTVNTDRSDPIQHQHSTSSAQLFHRVCFV